MPPTVAPQQVGPGKTSSTLYETVELYPAGSPSSVSAPLLYLTKRQVRVVVLLTTWVTGRPGEANCCCWPAATSATLPVPAGDRARQKYPDEQAAGPGCAKAAVALTPVAPPAARTAAATAVA